MYIINSSVCKGRVQKPQSGKLFAKGVSPPSTHHGKRKREVPPHHGKITTNQSINQTTIELRSNWCESGWVENVSNTDKISRMLIQASTNIEQIGLISLSSQESPHFFFYFWYQDSRIKICELRAQDGWTRLFGRFFKKHQISFNLLPSFVKRCCASEEYLDNIFWISSDGLTLCTCGAGHDDGGADNAEDDVAVEGGQESSCGHVHPKRTHRVSQVKKAGKKNN